MKSQINHHAATQRKSIDLTADSISQTSIKTGTTSVFSRNGCRDRTIMSEVGAADRSRLLRSKRAELRYINYPTGIVRKRVQRRIDACRYHGADNW